MTDKEAIERLKRIDIRFFLSGMNEQSNYIVDEADKTNNAIETALNLLQTQQAEIEHQKEKRENQKKELAILNEKQKEFNKLRNTVNSYKGQFERQQAEIEKKDKKSHFIQSELDKSNAEIIKLKRIIDEMANSFAEEEFYLEHCQTLIDNDICPDDCNKCVKQYFERKVENGR